VVAWAERREPRPVLRDRSRARLHEEEPDAALALGHDAVARGEGPAPHGHRDRAQILVGHLGEEGDAAQELEGRFRHVGKPTRPLWGDQPPEWASAVAGSRLTSALAFARERPPARRARSHPGGGCGVESQVTLNVPFMPAFACGSHWKVYVPFLSVTV